MKLFTSLAIAISLVSTSLPAIINPANAASAPSSFAPLVEKALPAVVNISTSQKIQQRGGIQFDFPDAPDGQQDMLREFFKRFGQGGGLGGGEPMEREVHSLGSGFIISADGYVVTNNHVVAKAEKIKVIMSDDTKLDAKLIGRDPKTDIALLKVESDKPLPYVSFGNSDEVRVGDWVIAIGNPFGLGGTVSAGIISARSRNINAGPFDDFIQTDAAINKGNSGGPMFDINGKVIGVNTAIFSPTGGSVGIGFSVPSVLAESVIKQLKQYGRTHRGWLGVKIQHVTEEVADSLGLGAPRGALVLDVDENGPAKPAGVKSGDIILSFDGKPVKEMRHLPRIVAETKIDKKVTVIVWRDGAEKSLNVTLGELDETEVAIDESDETDTKPAAEDKGTELLDMTLKKLNKSLRNKMKLDKSIAKGVVILKTKPNGLASKRGFRRGDIILGIVNQPDISSVSEFSDAIDKAKKSGRKFALVRVWRSDDVLLLTLPTAKE